METGHGLVGIPTPRGCTGPLEPFRVGPVSTRDDEQTVALVALLRARPQKMTWAQIAAEVSIRGEARSLWSEHFPDGLYGPTDEDRHWERARGEVAAWRAANYELRTVLDHTYPTALLGGWCLSRVGDLP